MGLVAQVKGPLKIMAHFAGVVKACSIVPFYTQWFLYSVVHKGIMQLGFTSGHLQFSSLKDGYPFTAGSTEFSIHLEQQNRCFRLLKILALEVNRGGGEIALV